MARFLEQIGSEMPFNFSSAQVVLRWIGESLLDENPYFSNVVGHVHRLHDSISLLSGHGLTQLWSILVTAIEDQSVSERLIKYEHVTLNPGKQVLSKSCNVD
jgi:hypothetical protein